MKKLYPVFLLICIFILASLNYSKAQQVYQLLAEDFETGAPSVILNGNGPGGISGNNKWVINNSFTGLGIYPNTISQDSTVSGTIGGAPFSHYLHIHDTVAVGSSNVKNCNYDPASASNNFAVIASGLCTKGFTDVTLAFFYLCEGNATDFGSLYYSADNGPWTQVGQAAYSNQSKWKYEVLTDSAFDDVTSLRFGFRWQNAAGSLPSNSSFGIDDIEIIGTYDSIASPINMLITNVTPDTVCQNNLLFVFWQLTDSLCDAFYEVELSDASGTFFNPTNLGVFTIANFQTAGAVAVIIPPTTPAGTCYRIRINRISPQPAITGIASACFVVNFCPNTVTTLQPPVTLDTNGVCINSVIDIPFYSTGVFVFNTYVAELSDSSGSFTAPYFIGSKFDDKAYDPSLGSQPGSIGGIVPNVPPGCNYYVRVRATSPGTIGSVWGPFCIVQCDIKTNKIHDLQFCINSTTGDSEMVYVDIHQFDSTTVYLPGNQFELQVLHGKTLALINQGGLGFVASSSNDSFYVVAPPLPQLLLLGIAPGSYYARIVATNSSVPDNSLGTMIHLKIGAPADIPPVIIPSDSAFCVGDIGSYFINPYNFNSQYQWTCNGINSGQPFFWDYYPLLVQFGGPGTLYFKVREWNYGCPGPVSDSIKSVVLTVPSVSILGQINVCRGDTLHYKVPFANNTFYAWSSTYGTIVDTANNEIDIVFDTVGTFQISIFALNKCGSDTGFRTLFVHDLPVANAGSDTTICAGSSANLSTVSGTGYAYKWSVGSTSVGTTNQITVSPPDTTTYYLQVTLTPGGCKSRDTVVVNVAVPLNNAIFTDSVCNGESVLLDPNVNGTAYFWSTGATSSQITATGLGLYTVTIAVQGEVCNRTDSFFVVQRTPFVTTHYDSLCAGSSIQLDPGFVNGTYQWNTGDTTQQITISSLGNYAVAISIPGNNCYRTDTFYVYQRTPFVTFHNDSLCTGSAIQLDPGFVNGTYLWNTGDTTQQINISSLGSYAVAISIPGNSCYRTDTFNVYQSNPLVTYHNDSLCAGSTIQLDPGFVNGNYQWNTGAITQQINVSTTGSYAVAISIPGNACYRADTFYVYPRAPFITNHDDSLCAGSVIQLDPGFVNGSYLWNTGATTQQLSVSASGSYSVAISIAGNTCYRTDTYYINIVLPNTNTYTDSLCLDSTITLSAVLPGGSYLWNTGATGMQILVNDIGVYYVTINGVGLFCAQIDTFIVYEKGCLKPTDNSITFPNVFTPNGDAFNEDFHAAYQGDYDAFLIVIYNRWGELVYESSDVAFKWNGTNKNDKQCPDGVYFYVAKTTAKGINNNYHGTVTLIRGSK